MTTYVSPARGMMSWGGQTVHVMATDLRRHWLILGAFAGLFLVSAVQVLLGAEAPYGPWTWWMPWIAGVALTLMTQSDSAARVGASWRVLPLRPSAVAVAKLTYAALFALACIPMDALTSLREFGEVVGPYYTWQRVIGAWVMFAAVAIAACSLDIASAVIAWVAVYVTMAVVAVSMDSVTIPSTMSLPLGVVLGAALVAPTLLTVHAYRTPNDGKRRIAMLGIVAGSFFLMMRLLPSAIDALARAGA